ncbi:MAG: hypothetical protein KatS3mg105_2968 [Gemmatales bacterium]|nr:MAG: hypothetical protein KatS3mg105_2968 [Gemmatales bacterium]
MSAPTGIDGPSLVAALKDCGITHVIWIPDSHLGKWDADLSNAPSIDLVRACREGEAIGIAAGLILGGKKPIVLMQCTGFFEAGDALRNVVHDLHLPLFLVVGVRSYYDYQCRRTQDTCPRFTEPIVRAWEIPYEVFERDRTADDLAASYRQSQASNQPKIILLAE